MKLLSRLWNRLRHFRQDEDLGDELRVHLELQAEDYEAMGLSHTEARRRAQLQLGQPQEIVERIRDQEWLTGIEGWYRDLVYGLRGLRKNPVFALTAILTLAVGIGANTAIFTLLHGLLLRSLPVPDAAALVRIGAVNTASKVPNPVMPYLMLEQLRRQQRSFTDISEWSRGWVTLEDAEGNPHIEDVGLVGGNSFEVLGVRPYVGRLISPSDNIRGGSTEGWTAVLSYGFWRERYGGDPQMIGRQLRLSNTLFTVVGIAPPEFRGIWPGVDPKLYLPIEFLTVLTNTQGWTRSAAVGRLKPGVSATEANAEIATYQTELFRQFLPEQIRTSPAFSTLTLRVESARTGLPTFFGQVYSAPLFMMQGLVAIVLLLCCVNVSGLMMSRIHARQHEFALRTAIGAARWRLIRQHLTESFVIALSGAALGGSAAWYGTAYMLPFFRHPMEGIGMSVHPDNSIFLITAFFSVLTTLLSGTLPAWRAGGVDPGNLLKSRTASGARRQIAGRAFIPVQVALSLVLVALASSLSESLNRLQTERTGFDVDHVTIQTAPFHLLRQQAERQLDLYQKMVDRLQQLPGIQSAAVTWYTPMTSFQATSIFQADGGPQDSQMAYNEVGPGYFRTMSTTIVEGREFERNERGREVCVLNKSAAAYLFPRQQAIGGYVRSLDDRRLPRGLICRVIGIAEDAKFANLREPPPRTLYFPVNAQSIQNARNLVFLIKASTKRDAVAAYRTASRELAPTVPFVLFATLREQMDAALGSERAVTLMSNFFSVVALFLSAIGLYALLSSSVAQRTGEIGIRIALGAARGAVLRMILKDAFLLLAAGVVLGIGGLLLSVQFVQKMFYGTSALDPIRLFATAGVLTAVTLIAGLLPALRASAIDPIRALRAD